MYKLFHISLILTWLFFSAPCILRSLCKLIQLHVSYTAV